ncbi:tetrahydromethanopterin S-methyltransferase subunit F [Methanimicrococcus sp. OttesenSCG-928-J09]|nr:tetrahydromethanopterin S-methyltransferase subunit F [Methanimicrococcus sp. OttesenSCG-928-J09]
MKLTGGDGVSKKSDVQNRMTQLDELVESISYRAQLISRSQKPDSGLMETRRVGFIAGFLTAVVFVLIIPLIVWGLISVF